ncbi:class I SAM-dependent methyltransferase [Chitinophaga alhagiae]|uniref:class I SAM-dependent methyltransferase n=1 Tax=Chitinophaga alhagiae TaxID=2203219 RepID=UPI000E5AF393|nr:class I SAM-dependent methyltransferase [Chitinophaga alhagiae]
MGFDISAINFLFHTRKKDVPFTKTLMLGRQSYQLDEFAFRKCFVQNGRQAATATALLQEDGAYVEPFLRYLGAETVHSMDASSYENATLIHDLNQPIPAEWRQQYDLVIDTGTLEHVFNFPVAIANAMQLVAAGGHYISITPANNYFGHGFYQFSPELLYRVLSPENGFRVEQMVFTTTRPFTDWYEVPDPKEVRSRVILENTRQSYLMTLAKKLADQPLFQTTPQQSDYEHIAWQEQQSLAAAGGKGLVQQLAAKLPESVKDRIRHWRTVLRGRHFRAMFRETGSGRPDFFRKVNRPA